MYKILTLNNISPKGLDLLPSDLYEVSSECADPHAILVRSHKMHEMPIPNTLLAVGRAGAGVNNIPVERMSELGIPVFNAPGANANAVKELVIAGMLMAARNLPQAWSYVRELEEAGETLNKAVEAGKKQFAGIELPGRTLGVIGLGAIGVRVANAARALGMRVIGFDPTISIGRAWELSSEVEKADSLEQLLATAQFITVHVPMLASTRGLIGQEQLARITPDTVLLNFARDGIVDDAAVTAALEANRLRCYVTDFPLAGQKNHPKVISLPHLGASTAEAEENCAVMVAEQIRAYLEEGSIRNSVNFPNVELPRAGNCRLSISNLNRPDMVAQISHVLGRSGVNIVHMVNESRAQFAYTLVDIECPQPDSAMSEISAIEGVLKVRRI